MNDPRPYWNDPATRDIALKLIADAGVEFAEATLRIMGGIEAGREAIKELRRKASSN